MFINLLALLSLTVFGGDSSGNGGNVYEGHIQRITAKRLLPALDHAKNAGLLNEAEKKTMKSLLASKVPFKVIKPARLESGRYFMLDGKEAVDFGVGNTRIVKDRTTRRIVIQWDEDDVIASTQSGTLFDENFIRKVFARSLQYAYATGGIETDEKGSDALAERLYVPASSESLVLPSSDYRYDIHRRAKELIALHEKVIALTRDRATVADQRARVTGLGQLLNYKFEAEDEAMAINLDLIERTIREDLRELQGK